MLYKKLGLKCGLEIHQQLEGKKLFCNCPTKLRDDEPDFAIKRKLRASAGESGETDIATLQEQLKDRTFIYQGYYDTTCLVETDSEPPHELNKDALYTTLQLCKLVNASIFPVVQVMRKIVVDGSNTSGFQRTALIARGGRVNTTEGIIRIENISLEEDAGRIISETTTKKTYCLDKLGIPLIEIGTAPDINTPSQCLEAAKKLGMLLRSLPGVKRGLGTIRQDVNVSIAAGARIEFKGVQELKMIPAIIELEVKRQSELLKIKEELRGVRLNPLEIVNLTILLQGCASQIVQKAIESNEKILGMNLHNFSGFLGRELQPGYRLGTELAGRAKVKTGVGGILHSDELPNYGFTEQEVKRIRKKLDCTPDDAFILVADEEEKAHLALQAVYERAKELFVGVPGEVRKDQPDGTSRYLRPLPGAERMYPETDVPLIKPDFEKIELPELLEERISRYKEKLALGKDLAEFVAKSNKMVLFEELVKNYPDIKPAFIAETLTSIPLEIKRKHGLDAEKLTEDHFRELFLCLSQSKIHKDIIIDALMDMILGKFDVKNYESLSTEELHRTITEIVNNNKNAPLGALMGLCMKQLAGKASGKVISEELRNILEKGHK